MNKKDGVKAESLREMLLKEAAEAGKAQEEANGVETQRQLERIILLQTVGQSLERAPALNGSP